MIKVSRKFVVAFNRDRDSYQVPIALQESGQLERLCTDIYFGQSKSSLLLSSLLRLSHRSRPTSQLSKSNVSVSPSAVFLQLLLKFHLLKTHDAFYRIDSTLSRLAFQIAVATGSDLLLYSGYALEAFQQSSLCDSNMKRLLFAYHPFGSYVIDILNSDFERYPFMHISHSNETARIHKLDSARVNEEARLADSIICASSFTARSISSSSKVDPRLISIIPYGFDLENSSSSPLHNDMQFRKKTLLFVGQGIQRKGIHHLIQVWNESFWKTCRLVLVLNNTDPGLSSLLSISNGDIVVKSSLTRTQLFQEYEYADIFVMPSLVEGFGYVYLEAMSRGCVVVGTSNTGLPDLKLPSHYCHVSIPSDLLDLSSKIESALNVVNSPSFSRTDVSNCLISHGWKSFRDRVSSLVSSI